MLNVWSSPLTHSTVNLNVGGHQPPPLFLLPNRNWKLDNAIGNSPPIASIPLPFFISTNDIQTVWLEISRNQGTKSHVNFFKRWRKSKKKKKMRWHVTRKYNEQIIRVCATDASFIFFAGNNKSNYWSHASCRQNQLFCAVVGVLSCTHKSIIYCNYHYPFFCNDHRNWPVPRFPEKIHIQCSPNFLTIMFSLSPTPWIYKKIAALIDSC